MGETLNQIILQVLTYAGINAIDKYGKTPLHDAVLYGFHGVIDTLIESGADINAKSGMKRTALHFAVSNYQYNQCIRTLSSHCDHSDPWMVKKLLNQENIHVNVRDVRGDTPLMWAVMEKQVFIVSALLIRGADPNICNKDCLTPLHVALTVKDPCIDTVFRLLNHHPSLICKDKAGKTPIDILNDIIKNSQCYRFAYIFAWNIAINYRMTRQLEEKLKSIPQLSKNLKNCSNELERMRNDSIAPGLTVFGYLMHGFNGSHFVSPTLQIYTPVVCRLVHGLYQNYFCMLLGRIPNRSLYRIMASTISARSQLSLENDYAKMNHDNFFANIDILFILSKYLSPLDIFCVIVAFCIRKIPESMRQIRERKLIFIKNLI